VVSGLPAGAYADVPFEIYPGIRPYRVAGAAAAGWRPTLSVFTSREPSWVIPLGLGTLEVATPEQAASFLGEFRLRGIRYVILHKDRLPPDRLDCWSRARARAGEPWGRVVFDDEHHRILDLHASPPEVYLPRARSEVGEVPGQPTQGRATTFRPYLPLLPGHYQAEFDVQTGGGEVAAHCEVCRLRRGTVAAWDPICQAPLRGGVCSPVRLEFEVPDGGGPEPVLGFRVVRGGPRVVRVRGVKVVRAEGAEGQ
jgi:hypothetical protein